MKKLKALQNEISDLMNKMYYVIECPNCHEKFVCEFNDIEHIMYEPIEKEITYYDCNTFQPHNEKILVSSDVNKDKYKFKINCQCGQEEVILTRAEYIKLKHVNWDGTNNIKFLLDTEETNNAIKFMKKHKKCVESNNLTIGEHFSYNIIQTSIGNMISIKCNICEKEKNITNYKNL